MRIRAGRELLGVVLLSAGVLHLLALMSFDIHDIPERAWPPNPHVANVFGPEGARYAFWVLEWIGLGPAYALGLLALAAGLGLGRLPAACLAGEAGHGAAARAQRDRWPSLAFARPLGACAAVVAGAALEHLLARDGLLGGMGWTGLNPGGYWGAYVAGRLPAAAPPLAGYGLVTLGGLVGLALALDVDPSRLGWRSRRGAPGRGAGARHPAGGWRGAAGQPAPAAQPSGPQAGEDCEGDPDLLEDLGAAGAPGVAGPPAGSAARSGLAELPEAGGAGGLAAEDAFAWDGERQLEEEGGEQGLAAAGHGTAAAGGPGTRAGRGRARAPRYTLPPETLLELPAPPPDDRREAVLRAQAEVLGRTLADFKVEARVVGAEPGPNVTRYELQLAAGVKIGRIAALADDLALALGAPSVRIVGPSPGRSTLGIEVPNPEQEVVRLRTLVESPEFRRRERAVPLLLGKDASGRPLIADLARMPHLLVAGATGSGKSVCINAIILSVLLTRTPHQVRLILIDPKMVELALYDKVPHLLAPVVTDMRQAPAVLQWAVEKMEERYRLLSAAAVRHLRSYNALGPHALAERLGLQGPHELRERSIPWHMPYVVVVIDEFADLMCVARREVENSIVRLAQKSRAVGIHLVLATQRPTADVITGLIKSNLPCRIAFQVASKVDSRTIIDQNGAETLVGQGDMLLLPPGTSRLVRAQGAYVSDEEVKAVVAHVRAAAEPEYDEDLVRAGREEPAGGEAGAGGEAEDPLFEQAVRIVLESQRGSASLLQRRLEIGYARASRLIDQMTERGILGPFKGAKAREILVTLEEWEAARAS
ncbi:MAG: hypothetical protein KatS3mg102_1365 [Planctomycetota bacterium]|nr:MAG: hypothetical protein KatS3mg102_1365 [Planctomycetota bacterium]